MSLPGWIGNELLKEAVCRSYGKDVRILGVDAKPAVPVGDNYTSDMFRVAVAYRQNGSKDLKVALIVKCCSEETVKEGLAKETRLFEKETSVYQNTLPDLCATLSGTVLSANCYVATLKPQGLLILEDLKPLGFRMAERRNGLDLTHCQLVMKTLAKLHAASVVLAKKGHEFVEKYDEGLFTNRLGNKVVEPFVTFGYRSLGCAVARWEGCEDVGKRMQGMSLETLVKRSIAAAGRSSIGFNVFNHGDMWINNVMFRYDGETPVDVRLVDFQMAVWSSPCVDLHYFLHTSPALSVYKTHLNSLLELYYQELHSCITSLGHKDLLPSFDKFMDEFNSRYYMAFLATATVLPIVRLPYRKDATFGDLMGGDDDGGIRYEAYNNPLFKEAAEYFVRKFEEQGLID